MTMSDQSTLLVLNLGSATLKAARFDSLRDRNAERIAATQRIEIALKESHGDSSGLLGQIIERLGFTEPPAWIGHRVVHGGDASNARVLDAAELERLHALARLAPLHQPPALALVRNASRLWPNAVQYGAFDTVWHTSLPARSRRLPVPQAWDALGVKRYGFHGLAFASAMRFLRDAAPNAGQGRAVLAHLGGGTSLCAVHDGHSVDTTMAMTPLDGLPMATRSGSLDPGALLFLLRNAGYTTDTLEQALYRESGLRGLSGLSGDMRDLLASESPGAKLALEVFALRVAQGIAAMATHLGGVDDLVFSGGIGANAAPIRSAIVAYLSWLGMTLDGDANEHGRARLSPSDAPVRIWRVEVNEEKEIAAARATISI